LENKFELLINGLIENNIGISNDFLSNDLSNHLKQNLLNAFNEQLLVAAKTGNSDKSVQNVETRSDSIYWLDRKHKNEHEDTFCDTIEGFIKHLNITCYAGISDYEFHYALYEKGSFYKKHLDQFQNNTNRQYSMISYLNEDWKEEDGGQLMIHHANHEQLVSPNQGKTVFFKSDKLEHEVLVTTTNRMSVTGWLKRG
jgi:SM-20-related protein